MVQLSSEQLKQIKEQIFRQIEAWPPEQAEPAKRELEAMSNKQFIEFLKKNNLIKLEDAPLSQQFPKSNKKPESVQCVFCSIAQGKTPSYKIDENKDALAVLEINPISYGHCLIIPKKHISSIEKIPQTNFSLAKKIAKKIKNKLKPKETEISSSCIMGHCILNVLPVYENETLKSERKKAPENELKNLKEKLEKKSRKRADALKVKKEKTIFKAPVRIP